MEQTRTIINRGVAPHWFCRLVSALYSLMRIYLTWKSHACKGRFQILLDRDRKKQGGDDRIDTETQHCIRNFRVMQAVCIS